MPVPSIPLDTETVVSELMEPLRRHLRTRVPCEDDANDLAQEACLKFIVELRRRDDIQNPRAYLRRIARNLLYVYYTNRSRYLVSTDIDVGSLRADLPEFEESMNDSLRLERINQIWRELSPKCQLVLQLRWRDGLRVAEIADHMNLSRAMIKKYLAQGLRHCRMRLTTSIERDRSAA